LDWREIPSSSDLDLGIDRNPLNHLHLCVFPTARLGVLLLSTLGPSAGAEIPVVELVGPVHPVSAAHVVSAINKADEEGAPLLVLRLDTPGGLDTSMRQIIDRMLNCRTPIVAFVGPSGARAASAGFLITIVADLAAMAPGTNIGAAHPSSSMGGMDEVMLKKVTSDTAAYIRGKAERRGRNAEMAEKAVVESRSFTEKEALDLKLIDLVASDLPSLLEAVEGREVRRFDGSLVTLHAKGHKTVRVEMNWRQAILSTIARPDILFLLLLGTLAGFGVELSHPGAIFPGILGAVCLILFLFAAQIIPINAAGVLLILFALCLFVAEVKVHSYGLLTIGGTIAMILGAMMLVDAPVAEMRISMKVLLPGVLVMAVGSFTLVRMVVEARRQRLTTGAEGMIGEKGQAETDLSPEGWVLAHGTRWKAVAEEPISRLEKVRVVGVEGLTLRVRKGP